MDWSRAEASGPLRVRQACTFDQRRYCAWLRGGRATDPGVQLYRRRNGFLLVQPERYAGEYPYVPHKAACMEDTDASISTAAIARYHSAETNSDRYCVCGHQAVK